MILSDFLAGNGIKAVFYGRHSTDGQNVETQRSICQKFAEKYEINIIDEYIDRNVSAFKKSLEQRKYIDLLRKDAREGKFDCVLVYKADRLARKIHQHMQIWGEFRELGIPIIVTESEKLYTTDSPHEMVVEFGLSSLEAENTRIRTRDFYNAHTEKGRWLGGVLPFGYQYEENDDGEKNITRIPGEVEKVKEIFSLYKQGYGFQRVANMLNENYPEDNWIREKVKVIITNPFYAGYTTSQRIVAGSGNSINPREEWKIGKCDKIEPLISEESWKECMELYEGKKDGKIHPSKFITPYLFKDILHCNDCDIALKGKNYQSGKKNKEGEPYGRRKYICPRCKKKWESLEVDLYLLEEVLSGWQFVYHTTEKDEIQMKVMEDIQGEIDELEHSIKNYQKEVNKLESNIEEAERKQRKLMEENPEPDELQHALVQYRLSLKKRIEGIKNVIEQKEKEKLNLELSYGDRDRFMEFITDVTDFSYSFDTPQFRKLLLYIFNKIMITEDYQYEVHAKVDLSNRGTIRIGF